MTGAIVVSGDGEEFGPLVCTAFGGYGAACAEATTAGRIDRRRDFALKQDTRTAALKLRVGDRDG